MNDSISTLRQRIESWLAQYLTASELDGFVVGVSGGIDSALCAKLGSEAARRSDKTITALSLPIAFDGQIDGRDMSRFYFANQIQNETFDLSDLYSAFITLIQVTNPVVRSNIRTRLRSTALYTYANENRLLVLGTLNRVEFSIGYFQKHAAIGDLLPLARLSKKTIRELAASYGFSESLISRKASGCVHGQNAEDEWGIHEEHIDLSVTEEWQCSAHPDVSAREGQAIQEMIAKTTHKRAFPPVFQP